MPLSASVNCWIESDSAAPFGPAGLRGTFDISDGKAARMGVMWSNWAAEPVLEAFGEKTPFKYTQLFRSRQEMVAWASEERAQTERRCDFLDSAFTD